MWSRALTATGRHSRGRSGRRRRARRGDLAQALGGTRRAHRRRPRKEVRARAPKRSRRARGGHVHRRDRQARRAAASFRFPARRRPRRPAGRRRRRARQGVVERSDLLGSPDEVLGNGHLSLPATSINQGRRNAKSGCRPDVVARSASQARLMPCYVLHHRHEPHECGVVFAASRGTRARSPPADARLVPVGRARDLVDGGGRVRGGRARAAALLRRRPHHRDGVTEVEIP